eukprot:NODE_144_length_15804_cov_0.729131.p3 type:complete len:573 gc:universal NODE_144_length_15804_cov_0.729131:139-1857(+)
MLASIVLAAPFAENDGFVYKGASCKTGYSSARGWCIKDAAYAFTTSNALMNDYNKDLDELLVHKLSVLVKSGENVVGDAPVEFSNTGSKQVEILYLDGTTGYPKQTTLSPYDSVIVETAQNGNADLSFIVDESGYVPKFKVAPVWMDDEDIVDPTKDALTRVSRIDAEQLSDIQGVKKQNIDQVVRSLTTLQNFKEVTHKGNTNMDDILDADVESAHMEADGENGFIKVVVKTLKGIKEFLVNGIKNAFRAVGWVLRQIGLTLVKVFKAVKAFFAWEDVVLTHKWLEQNLLKVRKASPKFIKDNEVKTVEKLKEMRDKTSGQIDSVIDMLKGQVPKEAEQIKNPAPESQYLMTVVSQNAKLIEFNGQTTSSLYPHLVTLDSAISNSTSRLDKVKEALKNAMVAVGKGLKTVSIFVLTTLLNLAKVLFHLFDDILIIGVSVASIVFYGVTELLWDMFTLKVELPFISDFYRKHVGGSELTLLSVSLLPSAAVATWAYKATHWGKAPFTQETPVNDMVLTNKMFSPKSIQKRDADDLVEVLLVILYVALEMLFFIAFFPFSLFFWWWFPWFDFY